jgi:hypothetical protein
MGSRVRALSVAGLVLGSAIAIGLLTSSAGAGPPGRWTQITGMHTGARSNLGLARGKDGRLHVLWAGPKRAPFTAIYDTTISAAGAVGKPQAVVSGWMAVNPPTAAVGADGSIHVVISGQKTSSTSDPYAGLNEVVGPGSWKLGTHAFGSSSITVPSNADVHSGLLKSGELVSVWQSAAAMLFQTGVDPATQPQVTTPAGQNPVIAVDQASGDAVIAYKGISTPGVFFRRILPALGAPAAMPQADRVEAPSIAARAGGGVYAAYTPDAGKVLLLRFGGGSKPVPVPKGARILTAGVAAGPEGRLWVFFGNEQSTYVTRTNKAVTAFEPVQTLASPPKAVQFFRLEGEGSVGPLDLFADVTVDGQTKDGSYHQQVQPALSLLAKKKLVRKNGTVTGVLLTVRVTDAGDAVAGARIAGLPGGSRTTGATGSADYNMPAGKKGPFTLTATKAGYVAAKLNVSL